MKPRSTVTALLAITESLLAARAKVRRAKQAASGLTGPRASRFAKLLGESRPLLLRIKAQSIS